eukprot:gb/GECG01001714.1/.p1 GENE.gb/GECG01001714.1/~~gb/GECG01001714.1/.p1  ORF type:complete len:343 (+),score=60.05 gb/GECG01001714.1/:1-1029(+)
MDEEEVFQEAVAYVKSLPEDPDEQVSNETKLRLYGLYKQATEGDNTQPKPSIFAGFAARAKWSAWDANRGMSCQEARKQYVEAIQELTNGEWLHAGSYLSPSATSQYMRTPASSSGTNIKTPSSSRPIQTKQKESSRINHVNGRNTTPARNTHQVLQHNANKEERGKEEEEEDFDKVLDELNVLLKEDYQRLDHIEQKLSKGSITANSQTAELCNQEHDYSDPLLTPSQSATIAAGNQLASFCKTLYQHMQQLREQQTDHQQQSIQSSIDTSVTSPQYWLDGLQEYLMSLKLFLFYWMNRALKKFRLFEDSPSRSALYILSLMFIALWTIHRLRLILQWTKS